MLKFMETPPLCPQLVVCPHCHTNGRIGVHSYSERRYKCHACGATFSETKGTPLYDLKYPRWLVTVVLTLLAHGCPIPAIVAAFYISERTVADWLAKAGQHAEAVQTAIVGQGHLTVHQVQFDELKVKTQRCSVWMATALEVFSRLFVWGEVAPARDRRLIDRLVARVRATAGVIPQAVLFVSDGLAAYPKAILRHFYTPVHTGRRGRPRHQVWPDLHIAQVIKSRVGGKVRALERRVVYGCRERVDELIALSQETWGVINTAFIERLNATFRARLPALARRTRHLARTVARLRAEMFWAGVVYNFCTVHGSLQATPAVAAGLVSHTWSVWELLLFRPSQSNSTLL